jgi:ribosomal protein S18 acetylase RimI-like enzyme
MKPKKFSNTTLIGSEISGNFREFKKLFSRLPAARLYENKGLLLIDSGTPFASWNSILTCDLPDVPTLQYHEEISQFYSQTKTPICWWICPDTYNTDLQKVPLFGNFRFVEASGAMAIDLEKYVPNNQRLNSFEITAVKQPEEIDAFISVLSRSFGLPIYTREALLALITQNVFNTPPLLLLYIGYCGGRAVGCAALFLTGEIAGLYHIGTLPSWRGRGIGTALTAHCLNEAKRLQKRRVVLRASESGEKLYTKLGFKRYGEFKKLVWNRHSYRNALWKAKYLLGMAADKIMEDAIWFS